MVGSLRYGSANKKLALAMSDLSEDFVVSEMIDIGHLCFYNPDLDKTPQPEWIAFRDAVKRVDCVLFVTPEYNHSMPPTIKNALDIGGSPIPNNLWNDKLCGIASISRGNFAEWNSNQHLMQSLRFLRARIFDKKEIRLGFSDSFFSETNNITDKNTESSVLEYMKDLSGWVKQSRHETMC